MVDPLDIEINGLKFQVKKHSSLDQLRLDKTVLGLVAPAMAGIKKGSTGKLEIDFDKSAGGLANLLIQLPDDIATSFFVKLFSRTVWVGSKGAVELKSEKAINDAFEDGEVMDIYKLAIEVMRYNKFSFFALSASGSEMLKTLISQKQTENDEPSGEQSAQ